LLGVIGYIVQFSMARLTTPWYAPVLATAGVLLTVVGFLMRPGVIRGVGALLVAAFCAFTWWSLVSFTRVPEYTGTAKAGQSIPSFTTTLADGQAITDADLRTGRPTVLTFFRGRW
jgi:hypothetical protein